MTMKAQVSGIVKSATYHTRNISRVRKYLTVDSAKKLVNSLVTSRLDYCNSLLAGIGDTQIKRLQRVQNYAARVTLRLPRSIDPPLAELHWLPISQRIKFKIAVIVYKALNGQAPNYLSELLHRFEPPRSLRFNQDNYLLNQPRAALVTGGDKTFRVNGPRVWNTIPQAIRCSADINCFKRSLKTFYYCDAFNVKRP